jgi:hypothetical protein
MNKPGQNPRSRQRERSKYWQDVSKKPPDEPRSKGISPENAATAEANQPQINETVATDMPTAQIHQPKAKSRTENKPGRSLHDTLTLATGIIVAVVYSFQLAAMLDSNKINRESLESVQRAFISPHQLRDSGNFAGIELRIDLENSGTTAARNTFVHHSSDYGFGEPDKLADRWAPGEIQSVQPGFVGPKDSDSSPTMTIGQARLRHMVEEHQHLYVWGWMKYRDVFKDTDEHITRYCFDFTAHPVIFKDGKPVAMSLDPRECLKGNCYDEQCKE